MGLLLLLMGGFQMSTGSTLMWAAAPSSARVSVAMRQAAGFYANQAAIQGGYHDVYAADLSASQSSKRAQGGLQISVTGSATPSVGMAYLVAWDATRDRFYLEAARQAGRALLKGQLCSGGWDYTIELDPAKREPFGYRMDAGCQEPRNDTGPGKTNLDNNATQGAIRFLIRLDRELAFADAAIHEGALFALNGLEKGQYPNGAWPQRFNRFPDENQFPSKPGAFPDVWSREWPGPVYHAHYTINDECTLNMIDVMLEAYRIYKDERYLQSAIRGGEFLLQAQLPEPQPAWAQQYDRWMHPAWGRQFEPPAVSGRESLDVIRTLLLLARETAQKRFLEPIPRALAYFKRSYLDDPVSDRSAGPRIARFYEMKTNRPLFLVKGTRLIVQNESWRLLDGYDLTYDDDHIVTHYTLKIGAQAIPQLEREYDRVKSAGSTTMRRPDRLFSMTPWRFFSGRPPEPTDPVERVERILESMDARGAWVQAGELGQNPRVVSFTPGKTMTLTVGDQVITVAPEQAIQVFEGTKPPIEEVLHSGTFNANLRLLSSYLKTAR